MTVITLIVAVCIVAAFVHRLRKTRRQLSDSEYAHSLATAKLENVEASYKALLSRANELSQERVKANQLLFQVEQYVGGIKEQLKKVLAVHHQMRRGLEGIAGYRNARVAGDGESCCLCVTALKSLATKALPTGLTLAGTIDEVAARMVKPTLHLAEAQKALDQAGGVCADGRHVKVDISGQVEYAKAIRKRLHETVSRLQNIIAKPLDHDSKSGEPLPFDAAIANAQERLGTSNVAVDLVKHEDGSQGIAIIVADKPKDHVLSPCEEGCSRSQHKLSTLDYGIASPICIVGKD